jgi:hypothetical protein
MITDYPELLFPAYLVGIAIVAGFMRELKCEEDATVTFSLLWPVAFPLFAIVGAGWLLSWIGRGPVRLVRWMRRPILPQAKVVRR